MIKYDTKRVEKRKEQGFHLTEVTEKELRLLEFMRRDARHCTFCGDPCCKYDNLFGRETYWCAFCWDNKYPPLGWDTYVNGRTYPWYLDQVEYDDKGVSKLRPPDISDADYIKMLEEQLAGAYYPSEVTEREQRAMLNFTKMLLAPLGIVHDDVTNEDGYCWAHPHVGRYAHPLDAIRAWLKETRNA